MQRLPVRQLSAISMMVALGAALRMGLGWFALSMPTQLYGVLIKVGFTETLAITSGFALGWIQGFMVGALTIVVSDLFMIPGPWTPFVAAIIGLLGLCGDLLRRCMNGPTIKSLAVVAVFLTLLSEFLQNVWFALFFGIPLVAALLAALPTTASAIVNNTVLLTALGPRVIKLLHERVM